MEVTRAESFPKEEKRETTTERMRPMKPFYLFIFVVYIHNYCSGTKVERERESERDENKCVNYNSTLK